MDGRDGLTYWDKVANEVLSGQEKQAGDWLAWLSFRAKVLGPFD